MTEPDDVLAQLTAIKAEYQQAAAVQEQRKQRVVDLAIIGLKQGIEPADIYAAQPLSQVWLRARIREAGLPPATPGTKPRGGRTTAKAKKAAPKTAMRTTKPKATD